jgi:HlyD family secretion protein
MKLLPYLTANVTFVIDHKDQILAVPNAALRWSPRSHGKPGRETAGGADGERKAGGEGERKSGADGDKTPGREKKAGMSTLWVLGPEGIRPERVRVGITDGTLTEVEAEGVHEGDQVVFDEATPGTPGTTTSNPFAPKLQGPRR